MTRRAIAAYLGAVVVIAWAVATAIAYARRERPVPAQWREDDVQPWDTRTMTLAADWWPEWIVEKSVTYHD
jgi:hypothetical protein